MILRRLELYKLCPYILGNNPFFSTKTYPTTSQKDKTNIQPQDTVHISKYGYCLTSNMPDNNISTVALSLPIGSRHELYNEKGLSHLLKCSVFKSNSKGLSQLAITRTSELSGISLKSILTRESLTIYIDALPDDINFVFQILSSFLTNTEHSKPHELSEIIQAAHFETLQTNSDPHYLIHEALLQTAFRSGLGNPMIAAEWRIPSLTFERLSAFKKRVFNQKNAKYSLIGINVPLELLKQYEKEHLHPLFGNTKGEQHSTVQTRYFGGETIIEADHGSLYLGLALPISPTVIKQHSRSTLSVIKSMLMGESLVPYSNPTGLLYKSSTINAKLVPFMSLFSDAGILGCVLSTTDNASLIEGGKVISKVLRRGMEKQITKEMLERAKNITKLNYASMVETRQGFIQDALDQISINGTHSPLSVVFQSIDSVSFDDVQKTLKELSNSNPSLVMLGSDLDERSFMEHLSISGTSVSL